MKHNYIVNKESCCNCANQKDFICSLQDNKEIDLNGLCDMHEALYSHKYTRYGLPYIMVGKKDEVLKRFDDNNNLKD